MKARFRNFILWIFFLIVPAFCSYICVKLLSPFLANHLFAYHIIADYLLFLLFWSLLCAFFIVVLIKIYPFSEGEFVFNSWMGMLWSLYATVYRIAGQHILMKFIPVIFLPQFYKIFGAKIGQGAMLGGYLADPILVEMGKGCVVGVGAVVTGHTIFSGHIIIKKIKISDHVTIGINSVIMPGVEIGCNSIILPGAVVLRDTKIGNQEMWGGTPALFIKKIDP